MPELIIPNQGYNAGLYPVTVGFLQLSGGAAISSSLTSVTDAAGGTSPLQLSTTNAYLPSGSFQIGDTSGSNYMYTLVGDALSNSFNLKLPLITTNDTLAALNVTQIFTQGQTIRNSDGLRIENDANQDAIIISGNPRGTNSHAITLKPFDVNLNKSHTLRLPNISNDDTLAALSIPQTFLAPQTIHSSLVLSATDSGGFLGLRAQTINTVPTPSSGVNVFANASGQFGWVNSLGYKRSFGNPSVTSDLTFTLPNSSGTLALTNVAQTFTALQTINVSSGVVLDVKFNGSSIFTVGQNVTGINNTVAALRLTSSTYVDANGSSSYRWATSGIGWNKLQPSRTIAAPITTTPATIASAIMQLESTTQGFLPPRMTSTQRSNLGTLSITAISGDGTKATYTVANHNLLPGESVTITGASVSGFNVTGNVVDVTNNTFTILNTTTGTATTASLNIGIGQGMVVFDTTFNKLYVYTNTWEVVQSS